MAHAAVLALCTQLGAAGCGRPMRMSVARTPANGRPATCPTSEEGGAIDMYGDGTPSAMANKCSYDDTLPGALTRIRGRVLEPEAVGPGIERGGVEVAVHRAPTPVNPATFSAPIARAVTDAQGQFTASALLRPGTYVVVVWGEHRPLAHRAFEVEGGGSAQATGLVLWLPRTAQ